MPWDIETDAESAARKRMGGIDDRYQIYHPDVGLVEAVGRLGEAFVIADECAARKNRHTGEPMYSDPFTFEVHDRMARKGRPTTWLRRPNDSTHCFEPGDWYSANAFWKCIMKKGLPQMQHGDLTTRLWS